MAPRIAQHLVPQVYLKRFADGAHRITILRRPSGSGDLFLPPRTVPVKKAAVRDDFYTLWNAEGIRSEFLESELGRVEQRFSSCFKRLRSPGDPSDDHLLEIQSLAVVQHMRSSRQRDFLRMLAGLQSAPEFATKDTETIFSSTAEIESFLAKQPDAAERRKAYDRWARVALPHAVEALRATFRRLYVCIVESAAQDFITSDHPVTVFDPTHKGPGDWGRFPYHRLPLEISYPLTRRHCAVLSYMEMPRRWAGNASMVTAINARTAACCEKDVYVTPFLADDGKHRVINDIKDHEAWRKPILWHLARPSGANTFLEACRADGVEEATRVRLPRWWWLGFEAFPPELKLALTKQMGSRPKTTN